MSSVPFSTLYNSLYASRTKLPGSHSSFDKVVSEPKLSNCYVFLCFHVCQRCRLDISVWFHNLVVYKMLVALLPLPLDLNVSSLHCNYQFPIQFCCQYLLLSPPILKSQLLQRYSIQQGCLVFPIKLVVGLFWFALVWFRALPYSI